MNRIEKFLEQYRNDDLNDGEIAAGLQNGEIEIPEWMGFSESMDHMKIWDSEEGGSSQMGFVWLEYDNHETE